MVILYNNYIYYNNKLGRNMTYKTVDRVLSLKQFFSQNPLTVQITTFSSRMPTIMTLIFSPKPGILYGLMFLIPLCLRIKSLIK